MLTSTGIGKVDDPTLDELRARAAAEPGNAAAQRELGQALYERLEFEEALQAFAGTIALDPADAEAHFWIGRVHFGHFQDLERSLCYFEAAVRSDPGHATARWLLARVLKQLGRAAGLEAHAAELDRAGKREWAAAIRR